MDATIMTVHLTSRVTCKMYVIRSTLTVVQENPGLLPKEAMNMYFSLQLQPTLFDKNEIPRLAFYLPYPNSDLDDVEFHTVAMVALPFRPIVSVPRRKPPNAAWRRDDGKRQVQGLPPRKGHCSFYIIFFGPQCG